MVKPKVTKCSRCNKDLPEGRVYSYCYDCARKYRADNLDASRAYNRKSMRKRLNRLEGKSLYEDYDRHCKDCGAVMASPEWRHKRCPTCLQMHNDEKRRQYYLNRHTVYGDYRDKDDRNQHGKGSRYGHSSPHKKTLQRLEENKNSSYISLGKSYRWYEDRHISKPEVEVMEGGTNP